MKILNRFRKSKKVQIPFRIIYDNGEFFPHHTCWRVYVYDVRICEFTTLQQAVDWAKDRAAYAHSLVTWTNEDGSKPIIDYRTGQKQIVRA